MGEKKKENDPRKINDLLSSVCDIPELYDPKEYIEVFAQSIFDSIDFLIRDFIDFIGSILISKDVMDQIDEYSNHNANVSYFVVSFEQRGYLIKIYNTCKILVAARNSSLISLGYDLDQIEKSFGDSLVSVFYEIVNSNDFASAINGKIDAIRKINDILIEKYYCNSNTDDGKNSNSDGVMPMDTTKQIEEKSKDTDNSNTTNDIIPKVDTKDASQDTKESAAG